MTQRFHFQPFLQFAFWVFRGGGFWEVGMQAQGAFPETGSVAAGYLCLSPIWWFLTFFGEGKTVFLCTSDYQSMLH